MNPSLWYGFAALFVLAGAINIARARVAGDLRSQPRFWLGLASMAWASTALLFWMAGKAPAVIGAVLGAGFMVRAALAPGKQQTGGR
jgi:hypothetical protein